MEKTTKYILWGLGVVAIGTGGYLLYQSRHAATEEEEMDAFKESITSTSSDPLPAPSKKTHTPKPASSTFPIKYGSKGVLVKQLQQALIGQYGADILPKYGADGYWGKELETALTAKGLKKVLYNADHARIIKTIANGEKEQDEKKKGEKEQKKTPEKDNYKGDGTTEKSISNQLHSSINSNDVYEALKGLVKIKNREMYLFVNEEFKKKRVYTFNDTWVSQTIVNALLGQFTSDTYRTKIKAQLYRIGLKNNGGVWSLSGLGSNESELVTIENAKIWDRKGRKVDVPKATVIGTFHRASNGITEFQAPDGNYFFVSTRSIRYRHD